MMDWSEPDRAVLHRHGRQFFKFGLVGVFNTGIDFLFYVMWIAFGLTPALANVAAFALTNPLSFLVNSKVTFRRDGRAAAISFKAYRTFLLAHLLSLTISTAVVWGGSDIFGPYMAKFAAIGVTVLVNYTASAFLVFPQAKLSSDRERESP